jgi:hypothetical protein
LLLRGTLIDGSLQLFGAEIMGSLSCTGGGSKAGGGGISGLLRTSSR